MAAFRPTLTSLDDRFNPSAGFIDLTPLTAYDARPSEPTPVERAYAPEWAACWLAVNEGSGDDAELLGPHVG